MPLTHHPIHKQLVSGEFQIRLGVACGLSQQLVRVQDAAKGWIGRYQQDAEVEAEGGRMVQGQEWVYLERYCA